MARRVKRFLKRPVARWIEFRCRWSKRRVGLALCYHRISDPEGDPERELVPPLGTQRFEAHVRYLKRRFRLVRASELLDAARERRRGGRFPVAITFDDDLPSHVRVAMPVLERHGAPATFFLSGASLERPFGFWWERLQRAWDRGVVDQAMVRDLVAGDADPGQPTIKRVAAAIEALPPGRRRELAQELGNRAGSDPPDSGMRAGDVERLAAAGFEIGFHTLHHDPLPSLDDRALAEAMIEGKGALERATETPIGGIAYPHGKADGRVAEAARAAGYRWGFTGSGQAVGPSSDPLMLGRHDPAVGTVDDLALGLARGLRDGRG
jgi:peptidoglycan/xylan/chitin deacetylase (PgdA/CDA1 family)